MKLFSLAFAFSVLGLIPIVSWAQPKDGESPTDHLPSYITLAASFGERPDWSLDGKKILFLTKSLGDAMELDVGTGKIRNVTSHYHHYGYTRAMYLSNGDIMLVGPEAYEVKQASRARWFTYLYVLDKSGKKPAVPLGVRINEGPAISRHRLHISWAEWSDPPSDPKVNAGSTMYEGDLVYTNGKPELVNRNLVLKATDLPFPCTIEPQNFRPPDEKELTFSAYSEAGRKSDVCSIDLVSKKITNYTHSPDIYDEPEGIFPDGQATLVECDKQSLKGNVGIDLWKLALHGSNSYIRLTHFSDYPHWKASNPVVSDDGRFIAFQAGKSGEGVNVGRGICVYDLTRAPEDAR